MARTTFGNRVIAALIAAAVAAGVPGELCADSAYNIDTPTTGMLDYGSYDLNFRLFSEGGILTRLDFGVFKIVNLGVSWEVSRVIGDQNISPGPPGLYLKIRPFSGGMHLPALAFGYDGQGYFYDKGTNAYRDEEKGVFIVLGREVLFSGLMINAGGNIADFQTNTVYGFANLGFTLEETFTLMAEYDHINYFPDARLNIGARFFVNDDLGIDLAARDVGAGRPAERIIRVNYRGKF